ncbi:hypothetical protein NTE_03405 [Candidatus Nitrososphaera evergladensis SR1]|uniref:Uncharacterized protein n=1 Tax=Candidatus Nitrososphaera evergladensis SR1 TaxID=1459636 RepID=A0A075MWC3_9ARCH|nr:hypothetical protein [Candidatus Nitrososphaera evergladensis]AIF85433.1 hypothetical protein NTE_03405 [Candidatus Nitrososphaera evergladensis SR1]
MARKIVEDARAKAADVKARQRGKQTPAALEERIAALEDTIEMLLHMVE